ncbi:MAG: bacillithiol biosynthesis cysteine-adding enzyme BshC [Pyrinomonadaceae bacterium]
MNQEIDCVSAAGDLRMRIESLPFARIPGQSKLFLDYIADPVSLSRYYPNAVASHVEIANRIADVLSRHEVDRTALCDVLQRQNTAVGAAAETLENIDLLRQSETVAVLTGQQAGVFTGPLYTIYKALSAVKMVACLRERGFAAVPVFWAATEDHDLDEVSVASVATDDGIADTFYRPRKYLEGSSVGTIAIDGSIDIAIADLFSQLPATEFSGKLRDLIASAYRSGENFGSSFTSLISRLFSQYGLIIVDPLDADIKRLAAPIYGTAIARSIDMVTAIRARSSKLVADGYHHQVTVEQDYFPLFWHSDDGRRRSLRVDPKDGSVRAAGEKFKATLPELQRIVSQEPTRFSPGVMLRPVVQDYLFPTVCYFGGAAEIAYFAQNSDVYRILDRPVTPILHRQSFTVIEARFDKYLEKLGLSFTDCFGSADDLSSKIVAGVVDPVTAALFPDIEAKIDSELERLALALAAIDPTLAAGFETKRRKIRYHLAAAKKKFETVRLKKDETADRRLRASMANLLPRGQLQERTINVTQYLDSYGMYFIDWIYKSIDLSDNSHRVIHF